MWLSTTYSKAKLLYFSRITSQARTYSGLSLTMDWYLRGALPMTQPPGASGWRAYHPYSICPSLEFVKVPINLQVLKWIRDGTTEGRSYEFIRKRARLSS